MERYEDFGKRRKKNGTLKYIVLIVILVGYVLVFQFPSATTVQGLTESSEGIYTGYLNVQSSQQVSATVTRAKQPYYGGLVSMYNYSSGNYFGNIHQMVLYGIPALFVVFLFHDLVLTRKKTEVKTNGKKTYDPYSWSNRCSVPTRNPRW